MIEGARRLSARIGVWAERAAQRWGKMRPNPYRIAWSQLAQHGRKYRVDADAASLPPLAWERWLLKQFISRIPGA